MVYFNIHAKALRKRDVDKFAIERYLANELESDYKSGINTLFPFMDDPDVDAPTSGANEYLSVANCKFNPIQPPSPNFWGEMQCGVAGGWVLRGPYGGSFSAFGDVLAAFWMESPFITERMDQETRVLVERHFTYGGTGIRIVAIEGAAGGVQGLSCIGDPSRLHAFAVHADSDGFLRFHRFQDGDVFNSMRKLEFRPDQGNLPYIDNETPTPDQFEKYVGYSGMLGDHPGFSPGYAASVSAFAPLDSFVYYTTASASALSASLGITEDQVRELNYTTGDSVTIETGKAYLGRTEITYSYYGDVNLYIYLRFKDGSELVGTVDSIRFSPGKRRVLRVDHRWVSCSTIEIVAASEETTELQDVEIHKITILGLDDRFANDFLEEETSSTEADKDKTALERLENRSLMFTTDMMSVGEDEDSRLFMFFNDKDGGISCLQSDDLGLSWYYHYGVIKSIENEYDARNPFIVQNFPANQAYLFYNMSGKVLCRQIDYTLFSFQDALLIERYYSDVLVRSDEDSGQPDQENLSIYSPDGRKMRYRAVSYVAAGDLNDEDFLSLTGRDVENNTFEYKEDLDVGQDDGSTSSVSVSKTVAIGPGTAFTNQDISDPYFSAYRTEQGTMRLLYLGSTADEDANLLQCHFSPDNGFNWYNLWEHADYGYNRLRTDPDRKTQFVDRSASGDRPTDLEGEDPKESGQEALSGINVHWSRLKRHKKEGATTSKDESIAIEIESPYAFYQHTAKNVFLFYVYEGCLLCKVFSDGLFENAIKNRETGGMTYVKNMIEKQTRSYFIDGNLTSDQLREEIHLWINTDSNEQMVDGNIVFPYQFAIDTFDENREIGAQRVCAYEMQNGNIRVFYKHKGRQDLRVAIWTGSQWYNEDLLRETGQFPPMDVPEAPENVTPVTGGFGSDSFERSGGS
jgi:hypothetical protein